jgi:hypothetical protein
MVSLKISRASGDVVSEGTPKGSDKRGLLGTAPDVNTFVITPLVMARAWKRSNSRYFIGLERLDLTKAQREDAINYLLDQAAELMAVAGEKPVLVLAPETLVWQ